MAQDLIMDHISILTKSFDLPQGGGRKPLGAQAPLSSPCSSFLLLQQSQPLPIERKHPH